jgi:hypothetical protein
MTIKSLVRVLVLATAVGFVSAPNAPAAYIGGLDGVANSSTFETGVLSTPLPTLGWDNVVDTAQVFDGGNGVLVHTSGGVGDGFDNYEVQYLTGVAVLPTYQYTLHFDMGFVAATVGGTADYSFQLGTWDGATFTALAAAQTGTITYGGNIASGAISGFDDLTVITGPIVSGNQLAVRWAQTDNPGPSDFFAFDNVTLDAIPVPEPGVASLLLVGAGAVLWRRRRNCP